MAFTEKENILSLKTCTHHDGINDTTDEAGFIPVVDMFRAQAKKNPDRTAVVSPTASLTYRELDELSDKVAATLFSMGVRPDDIIMVMLPRSVDTYTATLGILKAGAAYTVVNVNYPDDRIAYIYRDAGCRCLISSGGTVSDRLGLTADILKTRTLLMEDILSTDTSEPPRIAIDPSWLCYLIYTSGSEGKPKGVMIEHGNLFNFVYPSPKNHEARNIIEKGSVLLAMAQMTFDVSVMEEFLSLTSGMTVALATDEEIMNPLLMGDFLLKNRVDAVCFTPAYAGTLLGIPQLQESLRGIKVYDFGAESFPGSLFAKIRALNPHACIINGYGPTETTISCTMKVIESTDGVTIGKPNANVYAFVVDSELHELPKGKIGELLICGKGVGRGYVNLPEETARKFVRFNGMRAYRTGDLACINDDDEIEFHGRADNQVKLRGLRIELDEIEKAIAGHDEVKQSAVKVFDGRLLVGYYTLRDSGKGVDSGDIREFIRRSLAHYMIPDVLVELPEMPVTANQKIDRDALPRPVSQDAENEPPQNENQRVIVGILREIFQDAPVGISTDFMALGMSSLDVMLLAAELDRRFGVDVKFTDIFRNPTVTALEKMILSKSEKQTKETKDRYKCFGFATVMGQAYAADRTSTLWNLPYIFSGKREEISIEKLKKAVAQALNAHPGIWGHFCEENGDFYLLRNDSHPDYELSVREMTDEEFEEIRKNLVRPFFTGEPQLFRVEVYATPEKIHLFTDFSHFVVDGESYDIILRDIDRCYRGETLRPEQFTFFDVLDEQRMFVESGGEEKAAQYYRELFKKSPSKNLFPDDFKGGLLVANYTQYLNIAPETVSKIRESLRISDAMLFMGLSAACVARMGGNTSLYYHVANNGRCGSRTLDTVGFLARGFYALSQWDENTKAGEYLQALQRQSIEPMAFINQPFMFSEYPEAATYIFTYQGEGMLSNGIPLGEARLTSQPLSNEGNGGFYKIAPEIAIQNGRYHCFVQYRASELKEDTIKKFVHTLENMLLHFDSEMKLNDLLKVGEA